MRQNAPILRSGGLRLLVLAALFLLLGQGIAFSRIASAAPSSRSLQATQTAILIAVEPTVSITYTYPLPFLAKASTNGIGVNFTTYVTAQNIGTPTANV